MNRLRFGYRRTRRGFGLCQTKDLRQKTTEGFASLRRQRTTDNGQQTTDNGEASQVLCRTKDLGLTTTEGFASLRRQRTTDNGQRRGFASATPDKGLGTKD